MSKDISLNSIGSTRVQVVPGEKLFPDSDPFDPNKEYYHYSLNSVVAMRQYILAYFPERYTDVSKLGKNDLIHILRLEANRPVENETTDVDDSFEI